MDIQDGQHLKQIIIESLYTLIHRWTKDILRSSVSIILKRAGSKGRNCPWGSSMILIQLNWHFNSWNFEKANYFISTSVASCYGNIINPRCPCAVGVMVFILSVCMCVCLWLFLRYRLRGGSWAISIASVPQAHKLKLQFCRNDGIRDRETGIIMDRIARSNLSISDTCMRIT